MLMNSLTALCPLLPDGAESDKSHALLVLNHVRVRHVLRYIEIVGSLFWARSTA